MTDVAGAVQTFRPTVGALDLTSCDREPIRTPGAIQPHGALLALRAGDHMVVQASANAEVFLGMPASALLGHPISTLLGSAQAAHLRAVLDASAARGEDRARVPFRVTLVVDGAPRLLDCAVHAVRTAATPLVVLEFERAAPHDTLSLHGFHALVRQTMARVQAAPTLPAIAQAVAEQVRVITGYDRVWVYRFHEDLHGEIIAESRRAGIASWLGLHYPASDIPAPARALFVEHPLRVIADAHYEPVPVLAAPGPDAEAPLDLGGAVLRSVSPVHIQYMHNMGVRASLVVSLVHEGRLWGLVSGHHYDAPRTVPYEVRTVCEFLAQGFAIQLAMAERGAEREALLRVRGLVAPLLERLRRTDDPSAVLVAGTPALADLIGAGGLAVVEQGRVRTGGAVPPPDVIAALLAWLESRPADGPPRSDGVTLVTDALGTHCPPLAPHADVASGLLAVRTAPSPGEWLLAFRPEHVRTIRWAGDPQKPVELASDGTARLTPRASFAEWVESVRGRARPWSEADVTLAHELRDAYVDAVRRTERARADEALRGHLAFELDAVSALAAPTLRTTAQETRARAGTLASMPLDADVAAAALRLAELATRMDDLLGALHEHVRLGRTVLAPVPVAGDAVLDRALATLAPLLEVQQVELVRPASLPEVVADPEALRVVLEALVSNGARFRDGPGGRVEVGVLAREEPPATPVTWFVRDDGRGIARDDQGAVFTLGTRLDASAPPAAGTGVGLATARRLVERHGGRMWLESASGVGTTVFFTMDR
jgi:light-regulated signal transduction histidine kinase (bacteriophytochrome)